MQIGEEYLQQLFTDMENMILHNPQALLDMVNESKALLANKGHDYNSEATFLWAAPQAAGELVLMTTSQIMLALIGVKMARLRSVALLEAQSTKPVNEGLIGSFRDHLNYIFLITSYLMYRLGQDK